MLLYHKKKKSIPISEPPGLCNTAHLVPLLTGIQTPVGITWIKEKSVSS